MRVLVPPCLLRLRRHAAHEDRYESREGSLHKVVPTAVEAYLTCGRLEGGFARIRCPDCRAEHLLAFSCRTRNFYPSCQAKRSALFAEHVVTEILEPVPHRHVVLTIPRVRAILDRHDATPGLVVSIQTFGSYAANFHPHVHALVTDGAFTEEGEFLQLPYFDARLVEEVFRRRVLQRLHRAERLARYLTRGPMPIDVVEKVEGGRLRVRTAARSAHRARGEDPRSAARPLALARQLGATTEAHLRG